jgi:hypothetical protein
MCDGMSQLEKSVKEEVLASNTRSEETFKKQLDEEMTKIKYHLDEEMRGLHKKIEGMSENFEKKMGEGLVGLKEEMRQDAAQDREYLKKEMDLKHE